MQESFRTGVVVDHRASPQSRPTPPDPWSAPELKRYFIVTHGRSGSSLLAAILEMCGADFGPSCRSDRNPERDHWENRKIDRAIRCAHKANHHFSPAMSGVGRVAYKYWRSRAKALLGAGLQEAPWSKNRWSTVVLPLAEQLKYRPIPIVSYRHPAEIALSDMRQLKNMPSTFMTLITRTYLDALYALERYGGVVIDHADLMDPDSDEWAIALEAVTGLDACDLFAARGRLMKPNRLARDASGVWLPSDLRAVSQNLLSQRNIPLSNARRLQSFA